MIEEDYRAFRRRAVPAIARSIVRDPPVDPPLAAAPGGTAGEGDAAEDVAGGDVAGGGEDRSGANLESDVVVRLHPAVRDYLETEFDDALGEYDPRDLAAAVPAETPDPDTSATVPLEERNPNLDRGRLLAYRTVRADLLSELADHAGEFATAIEVHEALERLVGERGPTTDRRPGQVVDSFLEWIADRRDEATAEALRGRVTVLHVMRIAPLYTCEDDGSHDLAVALREWLSDAHPDALGVRSVTVER